MRETTILQVAKIHMFTGLSIAWWDPLNSLLSSDRLKRDEQKHENNAASMVKVFLTFEGTRECFHGRPWISSPCATSEIQSDRVSRLHYRFTITSRICTEALRSIPSNTDNVFSIPSFPWNFCERAKQKHDSRTRAR